MYSTTTAPRRGVDFGWIGQAWQLFTSQAGIWVLAALISGGISLVLMYAAELAVMVPTVMRMMPAPSTPGPDPAVMMRTMMPSMMLTGLLVGCVYLCLNAFFGGGLLKMANKAVRGHFVELSDLFSVGNSFVPLLICQLVFFVPYMLISLAVMAYVFAHMPAAAYIPGSTAYWHLLSQEITFGLAFDIVPLVLLGLFWPAASIAADGEGGIRALGKSFQAMKRYWLLAALFMLVMLILLFLSAIPCGLGLLATIPIFTIISSLMYRDMVGMPAGEAPVMPGYYAAPTGAWPPPPSTPAPGTPPAEQNPPPGWPPTPPAGGSPPAD